MKGVADILNALTNRQSNKLNNVSVRERPVRMENVNGLSPNGRLKQEVEQFCSRTTAHGICQISSSTTNKRRYFWSLIFLVAFTLTAYHVWGLIKLYLTHPVKTDVDVVLEGSLPFPSVTVCNLNQFLRSRLQNDSRMRSLSESLANNSDLSFKSKLANLMELKTILVKHNLSMESFAHPKEEFIAWCEVRRLLTTTGTCDSRNFTTLLTTTNVCFSFNGGNATKKVRTAGFQAGFSVILNLGADEHLPNPMEGSGVMVAVHQPSEIAEMSNTAFYVAPGTVNMISLVGKRIKRLGYPYGGGSDCKEEAEYFQNECLMKCINRHTLKSCNCEMDATASSVCNLENEDEEQCVTSVFDKVVPSTGACHKECPAACTQDLLLPTISTATWPSEEYFPIVTKSLEATNFTQTHILKDLQTARKNLLRIDVHYSTMFREHIIQKEGYTVESLTSDIGGQLGLFVGMSIMTVTEFLELFVMILMACFSGKRKPKTGTQDDGEAPNGYQARAQAEGQMNVFEISN